MLILSREFIVIIHVVVVLLALLNSSLIFLRLAKIQSPYLTQEYAARFAFGIGIGLVWPLLPIFYEYLLILRLPYVMLAALWTNAAALYVLRKLR